MKMKQKEKRFFLSSWTRTSL